MNNAYDALAAWFEYLNDDCGYEEWSQYLLTTLQKYGAGQTGLDIGCGSGYFTRQLYKNGYKMTGIDLSGEMIAKAQELSRKERCMGIDYVMGDVTTLKVPTRADFAVAVNDCFNYISPEKLTTAFKKVNGAIKKNGLFFFDVSSEKKLTSLPPVSIDDREDVTYFAFNKIEGKKVTMEVSLFVSEDKKQGKYIRLDETHTQYIHTIEEVEQALEKTGFELIFVSGHLGGDKTTSDRIEFLVRRM